MQIVRAGVVCFVFHRSSYCQATRTFVDANFRGNDIGRKTLGRSVHLEIHGHPFAQLCTIAFRNIELKFESVDLTDGGEDGGWRHNSAGADIAESELAAEGCPDLGFPDGLLHDVHIGFEVVDLEQAEIVFLLADTLDLEEFSLTLFGFFGDLELDFQFAHLGLEIAIVQFGQERAFRYPLTFPDIKLDQSAGNFRVNLGSLIGQQGAGDLDLCCQPGGLCDQGLNFKGFCPPCNLCGLGRGVFFLAARQDQYGSQNECEGIGFMVIGHLWPKIRG